MDDCRTPTISAFIEGPGEPGGTLPGGGFAGSFLLFNGSHWVPSSWTVPLAVTGGDAGELLTAVGAVSEFDAPLQHSLLYNNSAQTITATAVWLNQWQFGQSAATTAGAAGFSLALLAGNLRWLHVTNSSPIGTDLITYTVVVNGVDSALAVTLGSGQAGPVMNLTAVVPVAINDTISVRASGATATRTIRSSCYFFLEYT
jgi:hypothetical protein